MFPSRSHVLDFSRIENKGAIYIFNLKSPLHNSVYIEQYWNI